MSIKDLDPRIDIQFEEDVEYFLLWLPYHKTTWEFLDCFSMFGVRRKWIDEVKARRFKYEDYDGILELLYQYFPAIEMEEIF